LRAQRKKTTPRGPKRIFLGESAVRLLGVSMEEVQSWIVEGQHSKIMGWVFVTRNEHFRDFLQGSVGQNSIASCWAMRFEIGLQDGYIAIRLAD